MRAQQQVEENEEEDEEVSEYSYLPDRKMRKKKKKKKKKKKAKSAGAQDESSPKTAEAGLSSKEADNRCDQIISSRSRVLMAPCMAAP